MRAIKEARKFIENNPGHDAAITLSRLVLALEKEVDFPITDIYLLDYSNFKLALEILHDWRLDRHYASKSRLYDASLYLATVTPAEAVRTTADSSAPAAKADAKPSKEASAGKDKSAEKKKA